MSPLPISILELAPLLRKRSLSPVELTRDCLERIEKNNARLNAFITITAETALADAKAAQAEILQGNWRGPLHGVPIGLKDIIDTAGIRTTAASKVFENRIPEHDAEVVTRLKAAGAVLIGKQNLHECAYGGSSLISAFAPVRNPWNTEHIAGGSSGGSAAAIGAGLGWGAIGTDTGGSIREPSALCGVVGLKPTYGRVSARGVIPLSTSLDHIGPVAGTVADVAAMLHAIADPGARDANGSAVPIPDYPAALSSEVRDLRIGVPRAHFFENLDSEVAQAVDRALTVIQSLVSELRDISLAAESKRELQSYEAYVFHSQFLGDRSNLYDPETLRRILAGRDMEWSGYTRSLLDLKESRRKIASVFTDVDLLITPTVPVPAPAIAEFQQNPQQQRPRELILLRNTQPFNTWGLPAISVPCGFTQTGLPIGLQIAGPHWGEAAVLRLAHAYEQATEWHRHKPAL